MSAYVMIIPNPNYFVIGFSCLIAAILAGWSIADVIKNNTQSNDSISAE
ncbi:hypothetical protein [Aquibacillus kalidii]|nr:hypothetical protein [Aquibacillus kalidii]